MVYLISFLINLYYINKLTYLSWIIYSEKNNEIELINSYGPVIIQLWFLMTQISKTLIKKGPFWGMKMNILGRKPRYELQQTQHGIHNMPCNSTKEVYEIVTKKTKKAYCVSQYFVHLPYIFLKKRKL